MLWFGGYQQIYGGFTQSSLTLWPAMSQWLDRFMCIVYKSLIHLSQFYCMFLEGEIMKKLNTLAVLFAATALSATVGAQESHNWKSAAGDVWKNASGECWRDASWTPATAAPGCDGALMTPTAAPVAKAATPAAPAAPAAAVAPAAAAPAALAPVVAAGSAKVTFDADAYFDFDKSALKPEGKAKMDDLVNKSKGINLEVIIAVGHTDAVGADGYNQKLSVARAESVKAYLLSKGIEKSRVYTEGKGEANPVADNKTAAGRAKNRRVDIELVGTRAN